MALTLPGTPYVEASDLVAAYPAASENLADRVDLVGVLPFADSAARATAIPTPTDGQFTYLQDTNSLEFFNGSSFVPVGTPSGLVLIDTSTLTAVSSISIDNCFSATYDNYRIIFGGVVSASGAFFSANLRVGGSDNTTANYARQISRAFSTTADGIQGSSQTKFTDIFQGRTEGCQFSFDLYDPFSTKNTGLVGTGGQHQQIISVVGRFLATTSFDGIKMSLNTGTATGILRVYGYQNS